MKNERQQNDVECSNIKGTNKNKRCKYFLTRMLLATVFPINFPTTIYKQTKIYFED